MHIVDEELRKGLLLYTARNYRVPLQKTANGRTI